MFVASHGKGKGSLRRPPRIAVVGAGVGGLAAAETLLRFSEERSRPIELVLVDGADRVGGVTGTEAFEGALLERGPDSFVTHKPAALALCRRLGLEDRIVPHAPGPTQILHNGQLVPVPAGFALLAPSRIDPILASPLLGWRGKLRAAAESKVPRERSDEDESVASFVRRRFGDELYDRIAEPIAGAIHLADLERLSLAATFPRFRALEREHGSVTRGLRRAAELAGSGAGAPPAPPLAVLRGGCGALVDALAARLPEGALRLGGTVLRIERIESFEGDRTGFRLRIEGQTPLAADALLLATPARAAVRLLAEIEPALAAEIGSIGSASCVSLHLAWDRNAIARPPRSHGFFVPRTAASPLVAAGFLDAKFADRVAAGELVVRLFLGGALHPEVEGWSDAELVELGRATLAPLLGASAPPLWSHVVRHPGAMPQPAVGHLALVERARGRLAALPGLELAGGALGTYGLPDTIAAGESAAEGLFEVLSGAWRS